MKVLFVTPPLAFQNLGGGEIQMLKTKKYLEKLFKLEIEIFDVVNTRLNDYDIIHFFGSEYILFPLVSAAKNLKKKVIISSIFFDNKHFFTYKIATFISKRLPFRTSVLDRLELLKLADFVLPNSFIEAEYLRKAFDILPEKIHVIPNGIDVEEINDYLNAITQEDEEVFKKEYNINTPYFLYVARFDKRKNQLNLIKAFNELTKLENNIKLILVGLPNLDSIEYYNQCKKEALKSGGRIIFLPALKHDDKKLWIAYKCATAHIMPSLFETPGLASLEAAFCGCRLIVTTGGATREYFKDYALYVNPNDIDDIKEKMLAILKDKKTNELLKKSEMLKQEILKDYNWEKIAENTYKIYEMIGGLQ
ncbi:glycosyltransferase family 4 protein [Anaerocellum danielii]|uniref:Glycosyltransferase family 4 protein n=1 Tax=Anaerocellum danielii TaxID=1387557 RepID=A0ABZ0U2D3_9FIRM|nr:glycosyltransferase family 4 protein [Caldicellulosiruptor danielii]WPX08898.1 glycosyltransferase family 4 protein [Caldicellulosiruptor danielii]